MRKTFFFRNRRGGSASRQIATSSRVMRRATSDEAQVAELVDAYVSGAYAARCAGSSPVLGTKSGVILNISQLGCEKRRW